MDLPITLKFFRKLELYQELIKEDRKPRNQAVWNMVKALLRWTVTGHLHLYTPLTSQFVQNTLKEMKSNNTTSDEKFSELQVDQLYSKVLGDLVVRGLAQPLKETESNVEKARITLEGLYMGEVIYDYESGGFKKIKYPIFYCLAWLTVCLGILSLILSFVLLVKNLLCLF